MEEAKKGSKRQYVIAAMVVLMVMMVAPGFVAGTMVLDVCEKHNHYPWSDLDPKPHLCVAIGYYK